MSHPRPPRRPSPTQLLSIALLGALLLMGGTFLAPGVSAEEEAPTDDSAARIAALEARIKALEARVAALEGKDAPSEAATPTTPQATKENAATGRYELDLDEAIAYFAQAGQALSEEDEMSWRSSYEGVSMTIRIEADGRYKATMSQGQMTQSMNGRVEVEGKLVRFIREHPPVPASRPKLMGERAGKYLVLTPPGSKGKIPLTRVEEGAAAAPEATVAPPLGNTSWGVDVPRSTTEMRRYMSNVGGSMTPDERQRLLERVRGEMKKMVVDISLGTDGTWSGQMRPPGVPEAIPARGTWTQRGNAVELTTTHERDKPVDTPHLNKMEWRGGHLFFRPAPDAPALILSKR